jgi:8-hydroxy-5-deazaflavin:NADPH oxidoreductase
MTSIAILGGTGHQGSGLARRFAAAGAHVIVGSRDADRARTVVAGWSATGPTIEAGTYADAIDQSEVFVLTVPFTSVDTLLDEFGRHDLPGKLLIDVTVPVSFAGGQMAMLEVTEGSASEHIRARLPDSVRVAAAFKTLPAHLLADPSAPLDCDDFVCGDSDESRKRAIALVESLAGLRAVDVGALSRARSIEHLTALAIVINMRHKVPDARYRIVGLGPRRT